MTALATATDAPDTVVGVTILAATAPFVRDRVRTCGETYVYERHMEDRGATAILLRCTCPTGHGPARNPWRGWVRTRDARMDLTRIPAPASSYALLTCTTEEGTGDAEIITLDQIGTEVPAHRDAA